jgi:anti-sigma factor RsiW
MIDDCATITPLLMRAAEGRPLPGDETRLNAHLEGCPLCRAALAEQREVRELLRSHPVEGAAWGFETRVMAAVRAEAERRAGSWLNNLDFRRWTLRLVPVAAALALASAVISDREATGDPGTETATTVSADALPVSSALWSESVSESSLLSLMLTANADDTLSTYRKDQ